jgi:hypothetical protein
MSTKILALATENLALPCLGAILTIILAGVSMPAMATAAAAAPDGRRSGLRSSRDGRRTGPLSASTAWRAGTPHLPQKSSRRTDPPGARLAPARTRAVAEGRTVQLG